METQLDTKKKKYWYITEITECVLCGRTKKIRYRVYENPKKYGDSSIIYNNDACPQHFT